MIWVCEEQKNVLLKVNKMIEQNKTFEEITNYLYNNGFVYRVETKNGYTSKTRFEVCSASDMKYTFVDIIKRRNGLAYWETYKLN